MLSIQNDINFLSINELIKYWTAEMNKNIVNVWIMIHIWNLYPRITLYFIFKAFALSLTEYWSLLDLSYL